MFFVFGVSTKEKEIDFTQTTICPSCGSYGRYEVFMAYTHLSLFFIPVIKWNRKYYVRMSCCSSLYTIDNDLGKAIERGQKTTINQSELNPIKINYNRENYCPSCNYKLSSDYEYCPSCGRRV